LLGNDAKVGGVQAVARALEVARALKAHIVEYVKGISPELETLMFRPRKGEIFE
jgi:hypothetical protein